MIISPNDVIMACDRALKACDKLQIEQKLQIQFLKEKDVEQSEFISTLLQDNIKQKEEISKWYRDPVQIGSVAFILGLLVGFRK